MTKPRHCFCCSWMMFGKAEEMKNDIQSVETTSSVSNNTKRTILPSHLAESLRLKNSFLVAAAASTTSSSSLNLDCNPPVFILDCRSGDEFDLMHIVHSINVTLPTILQKRLIRGTLSACSVISAKESREFFSQVYKAALVVLIEEEMCHDCIIEQGNGQDKTTTANNNDSVSFMLYKKLREEGCEAKFIEGGLSRFSTEHPDLCKISSSLLEHLTETPTLFNLDTMKNLKLDDCYAETMSNNSCCATSSTCSSLTGDDCASSPEPICFTSPTTVLAVRPIVNDDFERSISFGRRNNENASPAQIIPYLFLGNSINSSDLDTLEKNNIKFILNVTPNLPNVFENDARFRYLQIPIDDHWSQNLFNYFPKAISFIDEARRQHCGVLVHCLAGISRSVTVTVAYLMRTLSMNLEDAYDLVKSQKPNIAPNLNFMGQLVDYEKHLFGANPPHSSTQQSPSIVDATHIEIDEQFLTTPLSAPPSREHRRTTKQTAECF